MQYPSQFLSQRATLRVVFDNAPIGFVFIAPNNHIEDANPIFCRMLGYSREELIGMRIIDITHPHDFNLELALSQKTRELSETSYTFEKRYIRKDGELLWVKLTTTYIQNETDMFALGMAEDISAQKKAEDALKRSESSARSILDASQQAIVLIDTNERIQLFNVVAADTVRFLFHRDLSTGSHVRDILPPEVYEGFATNFFRCLKGKQFRAERQITLQSGLTRWFGLGYTPIYNTHQTPQSVFFSAIDITEKVHNESKLRLQDTLLSQVRNAVIVVNHENNSILYWNSYAERLFGWSAQEVLGKTSGELNIQPNFTYATPHEVLASLNEQGYWEGDLTAKSRNGQTLHLFAISSLLRNHNGNIIGRLWVETDVSRQKELEQRLIQAQKLESIGTLTGGIAHDFNNLMMAILGNTELLKRDALNNPACEKKLSRIESAATRAAKLTSKLLGFSQQHEIRKTRVQLNSILSSAIGLLQSGIDKRIVMIKHFQENLPLIEADPNLLEQVILNLGQNAADALDAQLTVSPCILEFSTGHISSDAHLLDTQLSPSYSYLYFSIHDTGPGIAPEIKKKIFDPFFTTKPTGKGTGLGLSLVYGIVKSHDGVISIESSKEAGTTFTIYLPLGLKGESPFTD